MACGASRVKSIQSGVSSPRDPQPEPPKSIQQPDDKREKGPNGPFNPPLEQIQVTRGKRGGLAFIVNGKRTDADDVK